MKILFFLLLVLLFPFVSSSFCLGELQFFYNSDVLYTREPIRKASFYFSSPVDRNDMTVTFSAGKSDIFDINGQFFMNMRGCLTQQQPLTTRAQVIDSSTLKFHIQTEITSSDICHVDIFASELGQFHSPSSSGVLKPSLSITGEDPQPFKTKIYVRRRVTGMLSVYFPQRRRLRNGDSPPEIELLFPIDDRDFNSSSIFVKGLPHSPTLTANLSGCVLHAQQFVGIKNSYGAIKIDVNSGHIIPGKLCILDLKSDNFGTFGLKGLGRETYVWTDVTYCVSSWNVMKSVIDVSFYVSPNGPKAVRKGSVINYLSWKGKLMRNVDECKGGDACNGLSMKLREPLLSNGFQYNVVISGCVPQPLSEIVSVTNEYEVIVKFSNGMNMTSPCLMNVTGANGTPMIIPSGKFDSPEIMLKSVGVIGNSESVMGGVEDMVGSTGPLLVKGIDMIQMDITGDHIPGHVVDGLNISFIPEFTRNIKGLKFDVMMRTVGNLSPIPMFTQFSLFNITVSGCIPTKKITGVRMGRGMEHHGYYSTRYAQNLGVLFDEVELSENSVCNVFIESSVVGLRYPSSSSLRVCTLSDGEEKNKGLICEYISSKSSTYDCSEWFHLRSTAGYPRASHVREFALTASSAEISWMVIDPLHGPTVEGQVIYLLSSIVHNWDIPPFDSSLIKKIVLGKDVTSYVVTGLDPGRMYNFVVVPFASSGYCDTCSFSQTGMIHLPPPPLPSPPSHVIVSSQTFNSLGVLLRWSSSSPDVKSFVVGIIKDGHMRRTVVSVNSFPPAVVIRNLTYHTVYSFVVASVNRVGVGAWSHPVGYKTEYGKCVLMKAKINGPQFRVMKPLTTAQIITTSVITDPYPPSHVTVTWVPTSTPPFPFAGGRRIGHGNRLTVLTPLMERGVKYSLLTKFCLYCGIGPSQTLTCMNDTLSLYIGAVPLEASIVGGPAMRVPQGRGIVIDGSMSWNPNTHNSYGLVYNWGCFGGNCGQYKEYVDEANYVNKKKIVIPGESVSVEGSVRFSLHVSSDGYVNSTTVCIVVDVVGQGTPTVSIQQVLPPLSNGVGANTKLALQAISDPQRGRFMWTCGWRNGSHLIPVNINRFMGSGSASPFLIIPGGTLVGGKVYVFAAETVTVPKGRGEIEMSVIGPPVGGTVSVTPIISGETKAFNSSFLIETTGWVGGGNEPLVYSFFTQFTKSGVNHIISLSSGYSTESTVITTIPSPFTRRDATVEVIVRVRDGYGGMGHAERSVVLSSLASSTSECVMDVTDENSRMEEAVGNDDFPSVLSSFRSLGMLLSDMKDAEVTSEERERLVAVRNSVLDRGVETIRRHEEDVNNEVSSIFMTSTKSALEGNQTSEMRRKALETVQLLMSVTKDQPTQEVIDETVDIIESVIKEGKLSGSIDGRDVSNAVSALADSSVKNSVPDIEVNTIVGKRMSTSSMKLSGGYIGISSMNCSFSSSNYEASVTLSPDLSSKITAESTLSVYVFSDDVNPSRDMNLSTLSVSVSVRRSNAEVDISGLNLHPFELRIPRKEHISVRNATFNCSYWEKAHDRWSQDGVRLIGRSEKFFVCSTTHLTDFGVEMLSEGGSGGGSSDSGGKGGDSDTTIIIIIVCGVVVLVVLVFVVHILRKKKGKKYVALNEPLVFNDVDETDSYDA